jgi:hypothetical protein
MPDPVRNHSEARRWATPFGVRAAGNVVDLVILPVSLG